MVSSQLALWRGPQYGHEGESHEKPAAQREGEAAAQKMHASADQPQQLPELLEQELRGLPDKYRAAIVLCDLEGRTTGAAARELGCPQGTLRSRLVRGRAMLERRLMRKGVTLGAGAVAAALAQNVASAIMPLPLLASTIKAASLIAAGQAVSGAVGANVATLTEGVLKAMLMTKLKVAIAVIMALNLIGAGVGLVYCQTAGSGQDKGGGPPTAQEKADKPVPTDQQPPPKKEAKEEAKAGQPIDYQKMAQEDALATAGELDSGREWEQSVDDVRYGRRQKSLRVATASALSVLRRFERGRVPCNLSPLGFRL